MKLEIIILIILVFIVLYIIWYIIDTKIESKVEQNSEMYKQLMILNEKTVFYNLVNHQKIYQRYDNKSNYNRIEPSYLMAHDIRNNVAHYADICDKIRHNRETLVDYTSQVKNIKSTISIEKCEELKIPFKMFLYYEKRIFQKNISKPITTYTFDVTMNYISPQGKVNISKDGKYNFEDVFACLESVSRTYVDKKTYNMLAKTERGFLSDSLRYDVLNRDNFKCVICGAEASQGAHLHIDHIIPISKGGKTEYNNLQTLCERCNIGKSDKVDIEEKVVTEEIELLCPNCGGTMHLKTGMYGAFYGCSNYPRCHFTIDVKKTGDSE